MDILGGGLSCQPKCIKSLQENRTKRMCVCVCVCVCIYKEIYSEDSDNVIEEA